MSRIYFFTAGFGTIVAGLIFTGAGCVTISPGGPGAAGADGGVYKTVNKGDAWEQKVAVPTTTGEKLAISNVSVASLAQDPQQEANAMYVGTTENGLYVSYDGAESWLPTQFNRGRISSVAVDPKNKCVVYATAENKLYKTTDCLRTWPQKYLDTRLERQITSVAADHFNPQIIWIGNDIGDVLKSADGGNYWTLIKNFNNNKIVKILLHAGDSRRVFVATQSAGIWRSDDGGANWKNLSEKYKDFGGANELSDIALGVSDPNVVIFASRYGLIRSRDAGEKWESIDLLTPAGTTLIYSLAVDSKDANNIYYGTATTFYKTSNGGINWLPKRLPSSRAATAMIVDRFNPSVLYLGVTKFKQ